MSLLPGAGIMNIAIEIFSICLQVLAMAFAMRLIRISGRSLAWVCITLGIAGMAIRRMWSLYESVVTGSQPDMFFDVLGLVTSVFMVVGVSLIGPIFVSLQNFHAEQKRLIDELREAMGNIQTLRGFLPICSSCKKIRDDKGYWKQIETYIRDHSEAEFSHSICPECARRLYPEFYKEGDDPGEGNQVPAAAPD